MSHNVPLSSEIISKNVDGKAHNHVPFINEETLWIYQYITTKIKYYICLSKRCNCVSCLGTDVCTTRSLPIGTLCQ